VIYARIKKQGQEKPLWLEDELGSREIAIVFFNQELSSLIIFELLP
jgi:hypothetical protein